MSRTRMRRYMMCMDRAAAFGAFEMKSLPQWPRIVLAASFVFYNGASLINLNANTVNVNGG
eukprot:m.602842 g.602842  ORF g.602842 m.602842 type:complete len:61 (-) comp22451_c0_seq15:907-1089(-)